MLCSFCQSFDHNVNSCPYYNVSNECYARLDAMIGIMNEQHERFISRMRECSLLHETNPSLPYPRLGACLYDDCESSFPLGSNVIDDAPLTDPVEVFDLPLTPLTFVAPSFFSTPMGTGVSALTLHASPLSLA